ncbi:DUF1016 N-terminal domain-containing protein [Methanospirillum lacunae]|uniref:YhcG N-terminal domain-containing protein n=1 Tax=Methanospirillum lacunae TaxID=668570 RepID=A0A2V2N1S2_9EURY|nr:hypothetical protein DK846_06080 [Methanospirillum lacunae]
MCARGACIISWCHTITLLQYVKDLDIRIYYIKKAIEHGWSRNILVHQRESGLHLREGT